jgi:hypothetical protein
MSTNTARDLRTRISAWKLGCVAGFLNGVLAGTLATMIMFNEWPRGASVGILLLALVTGMVCTAVSARYRADLHNMLSIDSAEAASQLPTNGTRYPETEGDYIK